jgi:hypothetical protein
MQSKDDAMAKQRRSNAKKKKGALTNNLGHAMQAKGMKLVEDWMFEQVRLS